MYEKNYFCGWYFKCQGKEESIALIPAVHMTKGERTCSLQMIDKEGSRTVQLTAKECFLHKRKPYARFGENCFSDKEIRLNLHTDTIDTVGVLRFGKPSLLRYDIMGPFCCMPFMECRHHVFSMRHEVNGSLQVNGKDYHFENALGYIEGDRGFSFPKKYLWTQSFVKDGSLMLSVAEIPIGCIRFTGIIGVIYLRGKEYRLATYLGARVVKNENGVVVIRQGRLRLAVRFKEREAHPLQAPDRGSMTRTIHENLVGHVRYQLRIGNEILLDTKIDEASFEYEY